MAMRRARRGFGNRRRKRRHARWTAQFSNLDPAAGALAFSVLTDETDWGTSTSLESECLVHRIILHGDIFSSVATPTGAVVNVGIMKGSISTVPTFGTAVGDPGNFQAQVDSDWLWQGQYAVIMDADGFLFAHHVEKDIRVKRRLEGNENLLLVVSNAAGGVAIISRWAARLLVEPRL